MEVLLTLTEVFILVPTKAKSSDAPFVLLLALD